jgi:hypothetical protein
VFPALVVAGCSTNPRVSLPKNIPPADPRVIVQDLNRTGYGPHPADVAADADAAATAQLAALGSLCLTSEAFATTYYLPMVAARQK